MPLHIRVSFDDKSEAKEAERLAKLLEKYLSKKYKVRLNKKIYWNKRKNKKGGRIYMTLFTNH